MTSPEWLPEDRALFAALETYEASLCPGCGHPKKLAWHAEAEGWWNHHDVVCHSCTAKGGGATEVVFSVPFLDEKFNATQIPDFDIEKTITPPAPPPSTVDH